MVTYYGSSFFPQFLKNCWWYFPIKSLPPCITHFVQSYTSQTIFQDLSIVFNVFTYDNYLCFLIIFYSLVDIFNSINKKVCCTIEFKGRESERENSNKKCILLYIFGSYIILITNFITVIVILYFETAHIYLC